MRVFCEVIRKIIMKLNMFNFFFFIVSFFCLDVGAEAGGTDRTDGLMFNFQSNDPTVGVKIAGWPCTWMLLEHPKSVFNWMPAAY